VVAAANRNGPGQTVISGHADAVQRAMALAKERGAMKVILLEVTAPFHCSLMQPAADRLAADLEATTFADLAVPLVANVTAQAVRDGGTARDLLVRQVTAPVRWEESVKTLGDLGAVKALEVGPGKVLTGLVRRIDKRIDCVPAGTLEAIDALGGDA
jgi:[acyl-carrier-protein] S-malonyltransferase